MASDAVWVVVSEHPTPWVAEDGTPVVDVRTRRFLTRRSAYRSADAMLAGKETYSGDYIPPASNVTVTRGRIVWDDVNSEFRLRHLRDAYGRPTGEVA